MAERMNRWPSDPGSLPMLLATLPVPVRNARFMCIYGASDSEDRRDTVQDMQLAAAEWLVGDHSFLQY
jgi:hypothetical protein